MKKQNLNILKINLDCYLRTPHFIVIFLTCNKVQKILYRNNANWMSFECVLDDFIKGNLFVGLHTDTTGKQNKVSVSKTTSK